MDKHFSNEEINERLRFALENGTIETSKTDGEDVLRLSQADRHRLNQGEIELYGWPMEEEEIPVVDLWED